MQSTTSSTRTFMTQQPVGESKAPKRPRRQIHIGGRKQLPWILIGLLLIASVFLYMQYRSAQRKLSEGTATQQVSSLVSKVRRLVVLPSSETPTVATVVHADKLRNQTFFANALDGDKVLVYNREKEAVLYRPSTNQIVTMAPVNETSGTSSLSGQ